MNKASKSALGLLCIFSILHMAILVPQASVIARARMPAIPASVAIALAVIMILSASLSFFVALWGLFKNPNKSSAGVFLLSSAAISAFIFLYGNIPIY